MPYPLSAEILSFESFSALEQHLRVLKNRYNDAIKKYEETLGFILRDTKSGSVKGQKVQEKWVLEMQRAVTTTTAAKGKQIVKKEENKSKKLPFGLGNNKDKEKDNPLDDSGEWVSLDPMSLFIGKKHRGLAEIYFDAINILRDNVIKLTTALSICSALKAKAATTGNMSLVVSFVSDIPTKVVLKPIRDDGSKKYTLAFSFAVPGMTVSAQSLVMK